MQVLTKSAKTVETALASTLAPFSLRLSFHTFAFDFAFRLAFDFTFGPLAPGGRRTDFRLWSQRLGSELLSTAERSPDRNRRTISSVNTG